MSDPPGGTLLVLGASVHQLDTITAAQRRGLRVVVVDNVPSNPGHPLADVSYPDSTTDVGRVERIARDEAIGGIVAACTDVAVPTAAIVADRLGLSGVAPLVASLVTSKSGFRRWQRDAGLPYPEFHFVAELSEPPSAGRWIVKPDRASGARGMRIADAGPELAAAVEAARGDAGGVVVERVVEGHHLTIEALLKDGEMVWSVVLDRQTAVAPWCATVGHRLPTTLDRSKVDAAVAAVAATARSLDLRDGPLDADLVIGEEPVILELSPRLGGNSIGALAELAAGVDLVDAAVDAAMGIPITEPARAALSPAAVVLLGADGDGRLAYDEDGVESLRGEPWVALLEIAPAGGLVRRFVDGRAAVGRALIVGDDREQIDARAEELRRRVGLVAR